VRYEDVEPPGGDDPRDPNLFIREAYPVVERPTRAELDADEDRGWPRGNYSDGGV
jgi:hypothetical protein